MVLSIVLVWSAVRRMGRNTIANACVLFAGLALVLPPGVYDDPLAAPRILAPLLLFQALGTGRWGWVPLVLVTPRVWLELGPQVIGIVRGLV